METNKSESTKDSPQGGGPPCILQQGAGLVWEFGTSLERQCDRAGGRAGGPCQPSRHCFFRTVLVVVLVLFVLVGDVDVLVVQLVLRLPRHLVLLLQSPPSVGEPRAHLK